MEQNHKGSKLGGGAALVLAMMGVGLAIEGLQSTGQGGGGGGTPIGGGPKPPTTLTAWQSTGIVVGPDPTGSYIVQLGVSAQGGTMPYAFTIRMTDGWTSRNSTGLFTRSFGIVPTSTSGTVTVTSADGQTASVQVSASPN